MAARVELSRAVRGGLRGRPSASALDASARTLRCWGGHTARSRHPPVLRLQLGQAVLRAEATMEDLKTSTGELAVKAQVGGCARGAVNSVSWLKGCCTGGECAGLAERYVASPSHHSPCWKWPSSRRQYHIRTAKITDLANLMDVHAGGLERSHCRTGGVRGRGCPPGC